jgi:hypothetical protein
MKLVTLSRTLVACVALAVVSVGFAEEKEKKERKGEDKISAMDQAWVQMAALEDMVEIRPGKSQ